MGNVVFHQMLVQWVSDPQSADQCDSGCVFAAVAYFGWPILKVNNICLEVIRRPHFSGEEVIVVLLKLLMGRVLSKK